MSSTPAAKYSSISFEFGHSPLCTSSLALREFRPRLRGAKSFEWVTMGFIDAIFLFKCPTALKFWASDFVDFSLFKALELSRLSYRWLTCDFCKFFFFYFEIVTFYCYLLLVFGVVIALPYVCLVLHNCVRVYVQGHGSRLVLVSPLGSAFLFNDELLALLLRCLSLRIFEVWWLSLVSLPYDDCLLLFKRL